MKRLFGTIAAALVVAALIVLCAVLGRAGLSGLQRETLRILLIVCACSAAYCFIAGEAAKNYSQMDKLWSLLPIAYSWIVAAMGGMKARLVLFALIVTAWGVRLTVNFARKGAYSLRFWDGEEDYRWQIVKGSPAFSRAFLWTLFDLFFISIYQNLLVLGICMPALAVMELASPLGAWDIAAAVLALGFLALETVSDEYQWRFHRKKNRLLERGGSLEKLPRPYDLGFNTTGPWARMRHPNYLGEQGFWLSMYGFALGVSRHGFHPAAIPALLLVLLFMGSSALAERISAGKYPRYKDYIDQVYKYLPVRRFDRDR